MSLYMYEWGDMCICVCVSVYACVHTCGLRLMSGIVLNTVSTLFFKTGSFTELTVYQLAIISGQQVPGNLISSFPPCCDYRDMPAMPCFLLGCWISELSVTCLLSKYFTE